MGIFKDDEEKTTENVSLPEDLNLDDIGDDLGSLFDEDKTDDADDNVDKDLLSQIFSDGGDVSESDDKTSDGEMDEDLRMWQKSLRRRKLRKRRHQIIRKTIRKRIR